MDEYSHTTTTTTSTIHKSHDRIDAGEEYHGTTSEIVSWIGDTIEISVTTNHIFDTNIWMSNECGRFRTIGGYIAI